MVTYPKQGREKLLNDKMSDSANWRVVLFKNNLTPDLDTVLGDLTEADFSGYDRVTPTWGAITIAGSNRAKAVGSSCVFAHDGGGTANDVYGYALINPSSGDLLFIDRLAGAPAHKAGAGGF